MFDYEFSLTKYITILISHQLDQEGFFVFLFFFSFFFLIQERNVIGRIFSLEDEICMIGKFHHPFNKNKFL